MAQAVEIRFAGHGGDEIRGELSRPDGAANGPGIVVVHEVFGIDAFARSVAARLVDEGYTVLVPDLYARGGAPDPRGAGDPGAARGAEAARLALDALPDRRAVADLEGAAQRLAAEPGVDERSVAVIGFGAGGNLAFLLGCQSRRIAAVVDYYGAPVYPALSAQRPVQPLEMALNLSVPLRAVFGLEDASIPAADVDALERTLDQFAKSFELERVAHAGHGFADPLRGTGTPAAAEETWRGTLAFLAESLGLSAHQAGN